MAVILLLMLMAGFIFGIIAFNLFTNYSHWSGANKDFYWSFSTLELSLFSTFRLLTFDQWDTSSSDIALAVSPGVVYAWYFVWIWLGGFIFRNIFVGVVVTDFQRIKERIESQKNEFVKQRKFQKMRNKLNKELNVRGGVGNAAAIPIPKRIDVLKTAEMDTAQENTAAPVTRLSFGPSVVKEDVILSEDAVDEQDPQPQPIDPMLTDFAAEKKCSDVVAETMSVLQNDVSETKWPRDTLFKYFQLMETLQENMAEFQELQSIASNLLLQLHDD